MRFDRHFYVQTFGCRVNRVESDAIAASLLEAGWQLAPLEEAALVIVNTCTVTGEADAKNRKFIRRALRLTQGPVIVTGCATAIEIAPYAALDDRVVCVPQREEAAAKALELLGDSQNDAVETVPHVRYGAQFRTRAGIKVQDGCDNACTFCIVHTARGKAKSTPSAQVLKEARALADAGAEELVLVGIDLGAWREEERGLDFLISELLAKTGASRVRLSSIEPHSITPGLVDQLATLDGKLCRHLHVPLQSGSTKVLREMARHYNAEEFLALITKLREQVPNLALSTDVMVGFPGETDEDFAQTCEMARACNFMRLHVFSYSARPGTPAAAREDQVPPQVKAQRASELADIGRQLAREDLKRRVGTCEFVVAERPGRGTSESFHEVRFAEDIEPGALVQMRFTGFDAEELTLTGELTG